MTPTRFLVSALILLAASSLAWAQQQSTPKPSAPAQPQPRQAEPKPAQPAKPAQSAKPQPAPSTQAAVPGGAQPVWLGNYDNWGAYTAAPGGKKICFAIAKPDSAVTDPPNRPRDQAYFFIASRPAEKVKDEVSVLAGYPFKEKSEAVAEIGAAKFAMYTEKDGAWIANVADEARMVEAMRKGSELVVKGSSAKGTKSTDRYSLKGLAQALDRAAQECK
jgi:Invasion associated locus B (IalB) protein